MEHENHKWVEEEEEVEEDAALKKRQHSLSHSKDKIVTSSSLFSSPSSSPPTDNGGEHSNGVKDIDRSSVHKEEEVSRIGENGTHFDDDKVDHEAVGLGVVAEFAEEGTKGEATFSAVGTLNENSVYFDKQQGNEDNGVQNGVGANSVHLTNHVEGEFVEQVANSSIQNGLCNEVNNQCMETVDYKVPCSSELPPIPDSSEIKATAITNFDDKTSTKEGPSMVNEIDQTLTEYDVETVLAKQETHDLFCPNCNSCITKRVILKKRKRHSHTSDNKAKRDKLDSIVSANPVDSLTQEGNRGDHANGMDNIVDLAQPDGNNNDAEREPEVFRCLSCFTFFIPSGKVFSLVRSFRASRAQETSQHPSCVPESNLQNPSNAPGSDAYWITSPFTSNKGETTNKQGDASLAHSRTDPNVHHHPTSITSNIVTSTEISNPEGSLADAAVVKNIKPMPDVDGHGGLNSQISSTVESAKSEERIKNGIKSNTASGNEPLANQKWPNSLFQFDSSSGDARTNEGEKRNDYAAIIKTNNVESMSSMRFSDEMVSNHEIVQLATATTTETLVLSGEPAKDAILNPREGKPEFPVSTTVGSQILEKLAKELDKTPEIIQNGYSSLIQGAQSTVPSFGGSGLAGDVAKLSSGIDAKIPSKQDSTLTEKVQKDIEEEVNPSVRKENKGGYVLISVEGEQLDSKTSQIGDNVPGEGSIITESHAQISIGQQSMAEISEPQQWEILKSIVYGGLLESLTSLGIVASAAGSGAAPLNIIALGFANLVAGLIILGHNLNELKNDHSRGDLNRRNDRYREVLGHRDNFLFHAVVAVLSFLIFGSVPVVIYGLLISKNYYAEVKLGIVAATSIVCIILLAIGKVYTKRPPKSYVKTVLYYVTLAVSTSGLSYIAGNLVKDLLEKFSHSESGFAITMSTLDTSMEKTWMSY